MLRFGMLFVILLTGSIVAYADTGEQSRTDALLDTCSVLIADKPAEARTITDWMNTGVCIGTIKTAADFVAPYPEFFRISLPPDVNVGQLQKIFAKYAEDHPERLHEPYLRVLLDSWRTVFPYAPATKKAPR